MTGRPADDMLDIMRADTIILADKAYDSNAIRKKAKERGAWANIPPKRNRKASVTFSKWVYKQRNLVERFFNKLKQFHAIASRYEKNPLNFLAAIKLVAALIWIRSLCVYDLVRSCRYCSCISFSNCINTDNISDCTFACISPSRPAKYNTDIRTTSDPPINAIRASAFGEFFPAIQFLTVRSLAPVQAIMDLAIE